VLSGITDKVVQGETIVASDEIYAVKRVSARRLIQVAAACDSGGKLADQAGISNPYLSQIERGLRRPSAEILKSLARALEISTESLYERAGLLDGIERSGVEESIESDPALTNNQKQALTEIYRSFVTNEQKETA
jgi:transcriptional regulator with XRE-family HTH domain